MNIDTIFMNKNQLLYIIIKICCLHVISNGIQNTNLKLRVGSSFIIYDGIDLFILLMNQKQYKTNSFLLNIHKDQTSIYP